MRGMIEESEVLWLEVLMALGVELARFGKDVSQNIYTGIFEKQ